MGSSFVIGRYKRSDKVFGSVTKAAIGPRRVVLARLDALLRKPAG